MTSQILLDQNSLPDDITSVVFTPPPDSPFFKPCLCTAEEAPEKAIVKVSSIESSIAQKDKTRLGFPDCVYSHAAHLFQMAHREKPLTHKAIHYAPTTPTHIQDTAGLLYGEDSSSKQNELWAHELAFNALKFQELLEDALIDSCFCPSQQTPDSLTSLVVVMLYDLQDRKFRPREAVTEGEATIEEVRRTESRLFRTKLAASLARCRIKKNLLSIEDILPKSLRLKHQRKHKLPLCAWVNTFKISVEEACETLREVGLVQVDSHPHLEGSVFCKDAHCPDILLFPQQAHHHLDKTLIVTKHALIIQDKSHSLAISAVSSLLAKGADVLMVGFFSAQTVAHVAVHASGCDARVHLCGLPAHSTQKKRLQSTLDTIGCKNVQFHSEDFRELNEWEPQIQKVRVILLLPHCTVSGLSNPIKHIFQENGDRELLRDLAQGIISDTKLDLLVTKQMEDLSHALTFPKVHSVVYSTCSVYPEENELLVKRALENAIVRPKLRPFRIASTGWHEEGEEKFFKLEESDSTDGCFICVLKRDQEQSEPETVQDVLARAAAKGLLAGLMTLEPSQVKQKKRWKQKGAAATLPPLLLLPPSISDTSRLPNDLSVPDREYEPFHIAAALHTRAGSASVNTLKKTLNLIGEDSTDSGRTSFVLNEVSSTFNHASVALDKTSAADLVDSVTDKESSAVNKQAKGQKRKSKSQRTKQKQKTKNKSSIHKTKGQKPKKQMTKRQTPVRTTPAPPTSTVHSQTKTPTPPQNSDITTPKFQLPFKELSETKPQQNPLQEVVLALPPTALDLNTVIRLKREVQKSGKDMVRSMRVVLPPISADGRTLLSSSLQSSTTSLSTSSCLSNGLSPITSRSESRDSIRSGTKPWH